MGWIISGLIVVVLFVLSFLPFNGRRSDDANPKQEKSSFVPLDSSSDDLQQKNRENPKDSERIPSQSSNLSLPEDKPLSRASSVSSEQQEEHPERSFSKEMIFSSLSFIWLEDQIFHLQDENKKTKWTKTASDLIRSFEELKSENLIFIKNIKEKFSDLLSDYINNNGFSENSVFSEDKVKERLRTIFGASFNEGRVNFDASFDEGKVDFQDFLTSLQQEIQPASPDSSSSESVFKIEIGQSSSGVLPLEHQDDLSQGASKDQEKNNMSNVSSPHLKRKNGSHLLTELQKEEDSASFCLNGHLSEDQTLVAIDSQSHVLSVDLLSQPGSQASNLGIVKKSNQENFLDFKKINNSQKLLQDIYKREMVLISLFSTLLDQKINEFFGGGLGVVCGSLKKEFDSSLDDIVLEFNEKKEKLKSENLSFNQDTTGFDYKFFDVIFDMSEKLFTLFSKVFKAKYGNHLGSKVEYFFIPDDFFNSKKEEIKKRYSSLFSLFCEKDFDGILTDIHAVNKFFKQKKCLNPLIRSPKVNWIKSDAVEATETCMIQFTIFVNLVYKKFSPEFSFSQAILSGFIPFHTSLVIKSNKFNMFSIIETIYRFARVDVNVLRIVNADIVQYLKPKNHIFLLKSYLFFKEHEIKNQLIDVDKEHEIKNQLIDGDSDNIKFFEKISYEFLHDEAKEKLALLGNDNRCKELLENNYITREIMDNILYFLMKKNNSFECGRKDKDSDLFACFMNETLNGSSSLEMLENTNQKVFFIQGASDASLVNNSK